MTTNKTIEGTWDSYYEYGRGAKDEPGSSVHQIRFERVDNRWMGTSLPNDEGSEVTITLAESGSEFAGTWEEYTSLTGPFHGRKFKGLILLLLSPDGSELVGRWLGAGSSSKRVKTGVWTLKRA